MGDGFKRDYHASLLWKIEIEGLAVADFQAVTLPTAEVAVIEYNTGGSKSPSKRPGVVKWSNITLKRGYGHNTILQEWIANISKGVQDRRSISVIQEKEEGNEIGRWNLFNCWPCKWSIGEMAGGKNEVTVESIEMVVERMERVTAGE
jgi:phage tail-like protein